MLRIDVPRGEPPPRSGCTATATVRLKLPRTTDLPVFLSVMPLAVTTARGVMAGDVQQDCELEPPPASPPIPAEVAGVSRRSRRRGGECSPKIVARTPGRSAPCCAVQRSRRMPMHGPRWAGHSSAPRIGVARLLEAGPLRPSAKRPWNRANGPGSATPRKRASPPMKANRRRCHAGLCQASTWKGLGRRQYGRCPSLSEPRRHRSRTR